jgi:hypothetical protein
MDLAGDDAKLQTGKTKGDPTNRSASWQTFSKTAAWKGHILHVLRGPNDSG